MDVNFELYKVFYVVANRGSISRGAEELMISQPAVTQSIKTLEGQLGVTLFIRTKKGVVLTDEGRDFYFYIREGMNYFVNGYNKIKTLKNLESGVIRIGASTSITENFLLSYIMEFNKLYPNIEIKIINQLTDTLYKELRNGNLDLVVSSDGIYENKDFSFMKICDIHDIFVANKKLSLTNSELFSSKMIVQVLPAVTRVNFNNFLRNNNIDFKPFMEVVSQRLVSEFSINGLGIGVVTLEFNLDYLNNNRLFEVDTPLKLPTRSLGVYVPVNTILSHRVSAFLDLLKNKL